MNILYTISDSVYGGAQKHLLDLALGMKKMGHHCVIVCPHGEMVSEYKKSGLEVIPLEIKHDLDFGYILKLSQILKNRKIDILHTHLLKSSVNGLIAGLLAKTKFKISHIHGTLYDWEIPTIKKRINILANSLVTNLLADRVIALTQSIKKDLVKYDKIKESKIVVIPNGFEGQELEQVKDCDYLYKKFSWDQAQVKIIGIIGRLTIERGHRCFIKMAQVLIQKLNRTDLRFVIVGEGEMKEELVALVHEYNLEQYVKFSGFLDDREKNQALKSLTLFVSPSLREGFGLSVLQAMFARIPIVVSNLTVYQEVCPNKVCSIFARREDPEDFAKKVNDLLGNKELGQTLSQNAYQKAHQNYTIQRFLEYYEDLYQGRL